MNSRSSSPVIPSGVDAQSRHRYGGSMAGLKVFPASRASSSRWDSRSSRNFRNMIQVSSGSRSRSPLSPLSLRMMSRADLMRALRDCAVVTAAAIRRSALRGIEVPLELVHGRSKRIGAPEKLGRFGNLPTIGDRRYSQYVG